MFRILVPKTGIKCTHFLVVTQRDTRWCTFEFHIPTRAFAGRGEAFSDELIKILKLDDAEALNGTAPMGPGARALILHLGPNWSTSPPGKSSGGHQMDNGGGKGGHHKGGGQKGATGSRSSFHNGHQDMMDYMDMDY